MTPKDFTVGQKIYIVEVGRRERKIDAGLVTSIGRKWVHFKTGGYEKRFDPEQMRVDGLNNGWGPPHVVLNLEAYELEKKTEAAWAEFRRWVDIEFHVPDGVKLEDIAKAGENLGRKRA